MSAKGERTTMGKRARCASLRMTGTSSTPVAAEIQIQWHGKYQADSKPTELDLQSKIITLENRSPHM